MESLHLDVVDQRTQYFLKKGEEWEVRRYTKYPLTQGYWLVLLFDRLQWRCTATAELVFPGALRTDAIVWRAWGIFRFRLFNLIKRDSDVFVCGLDPGVVSDPDADKEKIFLFVDIVEQVVLQIALGRELHVGGLETQDEAFQVGVTKWHNLYCLILSPRPADLLNSHACREYETACLFLNLWGLFERVKDLTSQLLDTFNVLVNDVVFREPVYGEVFYDRHVVCSVGHNWSGTNEDLAFFLLLKRLLGNDAGNFARKLFQVIHQILIKLVVFVEVTETFRADFAFNFATEQFFHFDFLYFKLFFQAESETVFVFVKFAVVDNRIYFLIMINAQAMMHLLLLLLLLPIHLIIAL